MLWPKILRVLGVGLLLGMLLPRNDAAVGPVPAPEPAAETQTDADAIDFAAKLEAANQRIAELEATNEEKVRSEAERLVYEIFPDAPPAETPRTRHAEPADDPNLPPDEGPPEESEEDRIARIEERQNAFEVQQAASQLESHLDNLEERYPYMDKFRVLAQIARAGDRPVNIDALARASHNVQLERYEKYHQEKMAKVVAAPPKPPPVPGSPSGTPASTEKPTAATAARLLAEGLQQRGFGRG